MAGTILAVRSGVPYKCVTCGDEYYSWDTRHRLAPPRKRKRKQGEAEDFGTFEFRKGTWGGNAPAGVFLPPEVLDFNARFDGSAGSARDSGNGKVGECVVSVTATKGDGKARTWTAAFDGAPEKFPVRVDGYDGEPQRPLLLRVLGRQLNGALIQPEVEGFGVRTGEEAQVDFEGASRMALGDASQLGGFMRSLCTGSAEAPSEKAFEGDADLRKSGLASWACGQVLLGRQLGTGDRKVGALQALLAWGHTVKDATAFSWDLRNFGAFPCHAPGLECILFRSWSRPLLKNQGRDLFLYSGAQHESDPDTVAGLSAQPGAILKAMARRGRAAHLEKLARIRSGDVLGVRLDNIRFRSNVKISGKSTNLELTQRSISVVTRKMYRALKVNHAGAWRNGRTRDEASLDAELRARMTTVPGSALLSLQRAPLLNLMLDVEAMLTEAQARGIEVGGVPGVMSESGRPLDDRDADPGDYHDEFDKVYALNPKPPTPNPKPLSLNPTGTSSSQERILNLQPSSEP
jgi:hypothetical protein